MRPVNTYLLMVTYRVDMTCLFHELHLQLLGDEIDRFSRNLRIKRPFKYPADSDSITFAIIILWTIEINTRADRDTQTDTLQ